MKIATKIWRPLLHRPEGRSIVHLDVSAPQETLRNWWRWSSESATIEGGTLADKLANHRLLRSGTFEVRAEKRRGYIHLEAHTESDR